MKYFKKNISLIGLFFCLQLFSLLINIYVIKVNNLDELSNGLYTKNSIIIQDSDVKKCINQCSNYTNSKLFIEYSDVYREYIPNNSKWQPIMKEGKFFTKDDNENEAVIGKGMINLIEQSGATQYITFNETKYKVIGIMGASFISKADYIVLLKSKNVERVKENSKVVLDGLTRYQKKKLSKEGINFHKNENIGLNRTANSSFFNTVLIINTVLIVICGTCICVRLWYENKKKEFQVEFILGLPIKSTMNKNISKLITNIVLVGAAVTVIALFFQSVDSYKLIVCLWITNLISIIISLSCIKFFTFADRKKLYFYSKEKIYEKK